MRACNRALAVAFLLTVAPTLSACGGAPLERSARTTLGSDGPIISICGTNTGRAEALPGDGPVYIDASLHSPKKPISAVAGSSPIHVRVSQDCSTGAKVVVSNPAVIGVQDEIRAKDGAVEVTAVNPVRPGQSTLTARRRGVPPVTVTFAIEPPVVPSPSSPPQPTHSTRKTGSWTLHRNLRTATGDPPDRERWTSDASPRIPCYGALGRPLRSAMST